MLRSFVFAPLRGTKDCLQDDICCRDRMTLVHETWLQAGELPNFPIPRQ
jgi:hypothetical protein